MTRALLLVAVMAVVGCNGPSADDFDQCRSTCAAGVADVQVRYEGEAQAAHCYCCYTAHAGSEARPYNVCDESQLPSADDGEAHLP